jgi:hypothetical protein
LALENGNFVRNLTFVVVEDFALDPECAAVMRREVAPCGLLCMWQNFISVEPRINKAMEARLCYQTLNT